MKTAKHFTSQGTGKTGHTKVLNQNEIDRGLRALDSVKHCQDEMEDDERIHDSKMRNTPPNQWRFEDVVKQEETAHRING